MGEEADYMEDCQRVDEYDDRNRAAATHEVVAHCGRVAFRGSRRACWAYRSQHGGFVQENLED